MQRATRFRQLCERNYWTVFASFNIRFERAAREVAGIDGDPRLAEVSVGSRSYDRWMAGDLKTLPWPNTCRILEHLFGEPASQLFGPPLAEPAALTNGLPQVDGRAITVPPAAPLPPLAPSAAVAEADVTVPELLLHGFDAPVSVAAQTYRLTSSNASDSVLAMVKQTIAKIVARYEAVGPQQLAGEARVLREMLHGTLGGQQPPRARAELFGLASQVAGLLGYMAVNAGMKYEVVDAYCTEAEYLAREAGEVPMEMWASGTRSLGLYYQRRYAEAAEAALAGVALSPGNPQAIRLLVNGRSRALARLGDRQGAEQAIGQALELSGQTPLPNGLTSCISFEPYAMARTLANAITTRLSLGDTTKVLAHAEQIEELIAHSDSEWSRALVGLDVATALLQQPSPDVEEAMAVGRRALGSGTTPPIKSVWERAIELYQTAEPWHSEGDVGDYAEELRAWRSQPQAGTIVVASRAPIAP